MTNSTIPGNPFIDELDNRRFDSPDFARLALAVGSLTFEQRTANLIALAADGEFSQEVADKLDAELAGRLGLSEQDGDTGASLRAQVLREIADWLFDPSEGPLMCDELCGKPKCPDDIRIHFARDIETALRKKADKIEYKR